MDKNKLRKLTLAGLFTALTMVATMLIRIPAPKGYVNCGDVLVNISAWVLGPFYGSAAAGIGSALADMAAGYYIYAPATLVIKAAMAFVSYKIYKSAKGDKLWSKIAAATAAEVIMAVGYSVYEAVLYGSVIAAAVSSLGNIVQGLFGIVGSVLAYEVMMKHIQVFKK